MILIIFFPKTTPAVKARKPHRVNVPNLLQSYESHVPLPQIFFWRILAAAAAFWGLAPVQAAPVPVNNASFESANYSGANSWTNDLTDNNPATTI